MKKTLRTSLLLLLALALILAPQLTALAAETAGGLTGYVYDLADTLADTDWKDLNDRAGTVSQAYLCNIYVVTVQDYKEKGGEDLASYAQYLYENNGMGYGEDKDGILLLVSLAEGDVFVHAEGDRASRAFTSYAVNQMLDRVLEYLNKGDWAGGFGAYIDQCENCLKQAEAGTPVSAPAGQYTYVFDQAGILSEDEKYDLEQRCKSVADARGCGVYLVTVQDFAADGSKSVADYAEGFYHAHNLGLGEDRNGVMLLLSMADRDYDICAYGASSHTAFTDYGKDQVMPQYFLDNFRMNDWYGGFKDFAEVCDDMLARSNAGNPVDDYNYRRDEDYGPNYPFIIIVALIISIIVALISCAVMKSKLKTARLATEARDYLQGAPQMAIVRDVFTHVTEHREQIVDNSRAGGGGGGTTINSGGFSHSSGKF